MLLFFRQAGRISSEYGEREVTADVITAYHKGIDIAINTGTPVLAATDGEVVISKYSASYGNYIMVQNDEVKTVYAHCNELLKNVGDKVEKGEEIAKSRCDSARLQAHTCILKLELMMCVLTHEPY